MNVQDFIWKPRRHTRPHGASPLRESHGLGARHTPSGVTRVGLGLATAGAALAAYRLAVRPRHRHWGATPDEVTRTLPGDDLVPKARFRTTRAVTIHAPAALVWPWLVQVGQDRGGFYSYDWLERLVGLGTHNASTIHPEWQQLSEGHVVRMGPDECLGSQARMSVARIEDGHALILGPTPPARPDEGSWAFVVEPVDDTTTRLIARTRGMTPNVPPFFLVFDLVHFFMERRMLLGIKERAEAAQRAAGVADGQEVHEEAPAA